MTNAPAALSSKWTGLNQNLLAALYAVDQAGTPVDGPFVIGPITDGNIELTANWQSPFEQSGPDSSMPAIAQAAQSGVAESYVDLALGRDNDSALSKALNLLSPGLVADIRRSATGASREAQGRTGMTKLNSTQVFTGAAPVKIPLTMHFRAFSNPETEVQSPINQLARWVLARELAPQSFVAAAVQNSRDGKSAISVLLPSQAPTMVALAYGGFTFAPLVIESMTHALTGPRASDGALLHAAVQLSLSTLTAMDQGDWTRARQGQPIRLFNT
jgi:hypothetical protein